MTNEQLKKQIHRELTDASVKIFEKVGDGVQTLVWLGLPN